MTTQQRHGSLDPKILVLFGAIFVLTLSLLVVGEPQGATITANSTEGTPSNPPSNRTDPGGTITILDMDTTQQNQAWKAYVGNVSGRLTLDDAGGNTIYDWSIQSNNIQGEVYVSRNTSIVWSNVTCASQSTVNAEQSSLNMLSTDNDNINRTFNYTNHSSMQVGVNSITRDTCKSTATYINDSSQTVSNESSFQEILLQDQNSALLYATFIEQDEFNYKTTANATYDFQLIVGEDDQGSPNTYYFYMEVS